MAAYNILVVVLLCFTYLGVNGQQWTVNSTDNEPVPCLVAEMSIVFEVTYAANDNPTKTVTFPLMSNSTIDETSKCGVLVLKSPTGSTPDYTFTMTFSNNENISFVSLLSLAPKFEDQSEAVTININGPFFATSLDSSYFCTSEVNVTDDDTPAFFTFSSTQLQASKVPKDGSFSLAEECLEDMTTVAPPTTTAGPTTAAVTTMGTTTMPPTQPPAPTKPWAIPDTYKPDETCLLADFGAEFFIEYETTDKKKVIAQFELPVNTTMDETLSKCASNESIATLNLNFDTNNTLSLSFYRPEKDDTKYSLDIMSLSYLVELPYFNNSKDQGKLLVTTNDKLNLFTTSVGNYYKCMSSVTYNLTDNNKVKLDQVQFQVFKVVNGTFGDKGEICEADMTTPAPPKTTATHMPTSEPPTGHGTWNVTGTNGTVCMLVYMTLDFNINYTKTDKTNATAKVAMPTDASTGTSECGDTESTLRITQFYNDWTLELHFVKSTNGESTNGSKLADDDSEVTYAMDKMTLNYTTTNFPDAPSPVDMVAVSNATTNNYFNTSVEVSYKCNTEMNIMSQDGLTTFVFSDVKLQPFAEDTDFDKVEECAADNKDKKTSNIVPIAVGCALAGLILIVLIAYLIGRRRNQSGYQSV